MRGWFMVALLPVTIRVVAARDTHEVWNVPPAGQVQDGESVDLDSTGYPAPRVNERQCLGRGGTQTPRRAKLILRGNPRVARGAQTQETAMRRLFPLFFFLSISAAQAADAPKKVATVEGVTEYRLANGARV